MLMFSRKVGEKMVIVVPPSSVPQVITVTITDIDGKKVRVGTDADRSITVDREELYLSKLAVQKGGA